MTWQTILESASNADKVWAYTLVYTDGQQKFRREYRGDSMSDALLESVARSEIARLTSVADSGKLTYANGATVNTADVTPKPPTDAEIARSKFFADYSEWLRWQDAVRAGLENPSAPRIVELQGLMIAGWKREYWGLV